MADTGFFHYSIIYHLRGVEQNLSWCQPYYAPDDFKKNAFPEEGLNGPRMGAIEHRPNLRGVSTSGRPGEWGLHLGTVVTVWWLLGNPGPTRFLLSQTPKPLQSLVVRHKLYFMRPLKWHAFHKARFTGQGIYWDGQASRSSGKWRIKGVEWLGWDSGPALLNQRPACHPPPPV